MILFIISLCLDIPSVSGSSLYPTSFLSTGTTMPAQWNVLVTTCMWEEWSVNKGSVLKLWHRSKDWKKISSSFGLDLLPVTCDSRFDFQLLGCANNWLSFCPFWVQVQLNCYITGSGLLVTLLKRVPTFV